MFGVMDGKWSHGLQRFFSVPFLLLQPQCSLSLLTLEMSFTVFYYGHLLFLSPSFLKEKPSARRDKEDFPAWL